MPKKMQKMVPVEERMPMEQKRTSRGRPKKIRNVK